MLDVAAGCTDIFVPLKAFACETVAAFPDTVMTDDDKKMLDQLMVEFSKRAIKYGCDAVQVLTTIYDEKTGKTATRTCGNGNWYARKGMVSMSGVSTVISFSQMSSWFC